MGKLYPCVYCTEDGYCKKYSDEEVTSWCVQSPCKDEKPSNADRIRAMTDEELAMLIHDIVQAEMWRVQVRECITTDAGWLEWLKEEVSDGNHDH